MRVDTPASVFIRFMNQIIPSVNIFLEILPVQKSSDFTSLIICGFTLSAYFSYAFDSESYIVFIMQDLDSRLFIAEVEVFCWQDQLRQAVSIYYLPIFKSYFIDFHFIYLILIQISFQLIKNL